MARSFTYDRFFGEDIPEPIQAKLRARQNLQKSSRFGDSISHGANSTSEHPYKDINKSNFDGSVSDFSSRKPWARMWVAIQNYSLDPPLSELQQKAISDPVGYQEDPGAININKISIYSIGDSIYHDYVRATDYSDTDINLLKGSSNPFDDDKQGDFLGQNQLLKPGSGITSIEMSTSGYMGAIKETNVNFKVYNFYDYENIIVPYFLVPGAKVFVDFGWDTATLYDPKSLIDGTGTDPNFKFKDFYEKIYGDGGLISESQGDLEVLSGVVTKFDAKANGDGSFNCTVTFTSSNYALVDYDSATGIPIDQAIQDAVTTTLFERLQQDYKATNPEGFENLNTQTVLGNQYVRNTLPVYVGTQRRSKIFNGGKGGPVSTSLIPDIAYDTGVYYMMMDDKHQYEDMDTNAKFKNYTKAGNSELYITFKKLGEILTDLTGTQYDGFDDMDARFDFEGERVTYDELLMARQSMNSGELYQVLDFLYPTKSEYISVYKSYTDDEGNAGSEESTMDEQGDAAFTTAGWDMAYVQLDYMWIRFDLVVQSFSKKSNIKDALREVMNAVNDESLGIFDLEVTPAQSDNQLIISDINYRAAIKRLADNANEENEESEDSNSSPTNPANAEDIFEFKVFSPNTIMSSVDLQMTLANNALASRMAIQGMGANRMLYPVTAQTELDIAIKGQNQSAPGAGEEAEDSSTTDLNQYYTHVPLATKESSDKLMRNTVDIYLNPVYPTPDANPTKSKEKEMLQTQLFELYSKGMTMIPGQDARSTNWEYSDGKEWTKNMLPPDLVIGETDKVKASTPDYTDPEMVGHFPNPVYVDDIDNYFKLKLTNSKVENKIADVVLPYKLSFQIYGISGLQPGNRFKIDYLPKRQRLSAFFIIMKVQHTVNNGNWITKIEAQMHMKGDYAFKNTVSYKPTVHLSTKKMVDLGYIKAQIDDIRKNDLNWWSIQPDMLVNPGCNDSNAINWDSTTKLDCDGVQDGSACWCCEYCVSYEFADYALKKEVTATITGNESGGYGIHMGGDDGEWGCNHGKINGLDVVFDEDQLKIGNRVCSYPPNEAEQNAIFNPTVEDDDLGGDYVEKVQEVVQEPCAKPSCAETTAYCKSIDAWSDDTMQIVCQDYSTLTHMYEMRENISNKVGRLHKTYYDVDKYGASGYWVTDPNEGRNECSHLRSRQLCFVDWSGSDSCEPNPSYCE
tara:strand:+ start:8219 stop:11794 length:3576 start_codon:yes stop_codon:yes gene_type:complete